MRVAEGFVALSLPGFGTVVRSAEGARFRYACDALLGVPLSNSAPALALRPDGTLLLGTASGLRAMTRDGCPSAVGGLAQEAVHALAQDGATMFAFAGEGVWKSTDAGDNWQLQSPFAGGSQVTGVVFSNGKLYASRGAQLLVSSDEGVSFTATAAERDFTLLAADTGLWAVARSAKTVGARGYEVWRADDLVWRSVLSLNYFGGLTLDAAGTVWVGDAGGGLYRFDGTSFTNVDDALYPSCLQADGERLYSCNEDLPTQPALLEGDTSVLALAQVDELVACEGVQTLCAAAWVEWRRDVLSLPVLPDGGLAMLDAGVVDAAGVDAAVALTNVDAATTPVPNHDDGCSLGASGGGAYWMLAWLLRSRRRQR